MSKTWNEIEFDLKKHFDEKDIEWRVQSCGKKANNDIWALIIPYIDARAIMNRLDNVLGINNWKDEYIFNEDNKSVLCKLSIRVDGEWITKIDGSDMTKIEPTKGGISGALKRAGAKFGIGRYLYDMDVEFVNGITSGAKGKIKGTVKGKNGQQDVYFTCNPPKMREKFLPQRNEDSFYSADNSQLEKWETEYIKLGFDEKIKSKWLKIMHDTNVSDYKNSLKIKDINRDINHVFTKGKEWCLRLIYLFEGIDVNTSANTFTKKCEYLKKQGYEKSVSLMTVDELIHCTMQEESFYQENSEV